MQNFDNCILVELLLFLRRTSETKKKKFSSCLVCHMKTYFDDIFQAKKKPHFQSDKILNWKIERMQNKK